MTGSKAGIARQARRMAKMSNPKERLAALDRIATILERAIIRREAQLADEKAPPAEIDQERDR
jgi:hypothetical protein